MTLGTAAVFLRVQEMVEVAQKLGPGIIRQLDQYIAAVAVTS
jgi:hypothetical protein